MKNIRLAILLIVALSACVAQAQEKHFGFRFGMNVSSLGSQSFELQTEPGATALDIPGDVTESRYGVGAYFFGEFPLSERLSIQPELGFASMGVKYQPLRIDYLQLPIGLKANLGDHLYIMAGPQVSGKIWFHEQSGNYNYLDLSGFGAIGYNINETFFLDVRYNLGFTEVYSDDARVDIIEKVDNSDGTISISRENELVNLSGKNRYLQVSLGIRL